MTCLTNYAIKYVYPNKPISYVFDIRKERNGYCAIIRYYMNNQKSLVGLNNVKLWIEILK